MATARLPGLFAPKPVDEGALESDGGLRRAVGALDLTALGVGAVIGTGIFVVIGQAIGDSGPAIVLSFVLAGLTCMFSALSYAELASTMPVSGSAYAYVYATMGELPAWIIGWDLVLEFALGAAVVARGWSGYLGELLDLPAAFFGETSVVNIGAIGITLLLGAVAMVGIRQSSRVTNVLVVVKVGICVFVVVAGAFFLKAANLTPFVPPAEPVGDGESGLTQPLSQMLFGIEPSAFGMAGVLTAAAVVFFAYTGFEAVANLGEETRRPARDLPLGLFGTLGVSALLYVAVSFVVVGMVDYKVIDPGAPIASAFEAVGAGWASVLVSIAAVAGLTSVILVDIVAIGRIGFAMSRDRLLPPAVGAVHPRWGTPYRTTIAVTVGIAALAGFVPLSSLANLVSIGTLFAFVVVSVAVPLLRRTRPDLKRPFKVPLSPVVPALSALACLYLMTNLSVETWLRFAVWMLAGLAIYVAYGRRRSRIAARD